MLNYQDEISRDPPAGIVMRASEDGDPVFYAFGCVLLEKDTGTHYVYSVQNILTGKSEVISRRTFPMTQGDEEAFLNRIRTSKVAGASRFLADRTFTDCLKPDKAREIMDAIYMEILPRNGYAVRKEQVALAVHILGELSKRGFLIAEAETGIGKTIAYLIPAILIKRGRVNDFWNTGLYPAMAYVDLAKLPIAVSTSSIALQRALLTDFIPELSGILMGNGVIKTPLTAALRKGREHYICEQNLRTYMQFEDNAHIKRELATVMVSGEIDIAELDITPYVKRRISVSGRCSYACPHRWSCQYMRFSKQARSSETDIQILNHQMLLADTLLRAAGHKPIVPNYQTLIIDEAHRFLDAARSMYGVELSSMAAQEILSWIGRVPFSRGFIYMEARRTAKKLFDENSKLFRGLAVNAVFDDDGDDNDRHTIRIGKDESRHLRNIRDIVYRLILILKDEAFYAKAVELLEWVGRKHKTDTSCIDLDKLIPYCVGKQDDLDSQAERMRVQTAELYKLLCNLPEIKKKSEIEQGHRQARYFGMNPERQAILNDKSEVNDAIWRKTTKLLSVKNLAISADDRTSRLIGDLEETFRKVDGLAKHSGLICWLETDENGSRLCAIPKDLSKRLYENLWGKSVATVLTSGTLSAAGDFTHTKRRLGLDLLGNKVSEISKPSPFDYRSNAMLYISETMPFPDNKDTGYIAAVTDEVERLIYAANGHTAVLFTSYKTMGIVHSSLKQRGLPFPLFRLDRGGVMEISRFKESGNGVLFASGALWEGIDIPGDALSMLIIVKLPFTFPDPISEYEQTLYPSMEEYKRRVIVPEMLMKLKQGFGRLLRTENDSGVAAILDSRASSTGAYRSHVLQTLPDCRTTSDIKEVEGFFKVMKPQEYFR